MASSKYSRQREVIRNYLNSTTEHPTADMVYASVREIFPNISLGTVYRNLNLLVREGEAVKIDCGDVSERFDGRTDNHYHFICVDCNRVSDLCLESIEHINTLAANGFGGEILGHKTYFYGRCAECKSKNLKKEID